VISYPVEVPVFIVRVFADPFTGTGTFGQAVVAHRDPFTAIVDGLRRARVAQASRGAPRIDLASSAPVPWYQSHVYERPFPVPAAPPGDDAAELRWLLRRLRAAGFPYAVAQEPAEAELAPIRCLRVTILGMETETAAPLGPGRVWPDRPAESAPSDRWAGARQEPGSPVAFAFRQPAGRFAFDGSGSL